MYMILSFLGLVSCVCVPIGLVLAVVNKIRKKPAKKALRLAVVSVAVFIATAVMLPKAPVEQRGEYDGQTNAMANTGDISNDNRAEPEKNNNISSESKQAVERSDDAEYIGANLWLKDSTEFSEGRAWIQFQESDRKKGSVDAAIERVETALGDDINRLFYGLQHYNSQGDNRAALIDTQGKILWESDLTKNDKVLTEVSEFRNGLAYCVFNGNDESSYIILDSDGNVTFTRAYEEDYRILGHGNGLFLAAEHTASFDTNEWKIGAIDKNGNTVVPFKTYEKTPPFDKPVPVAPPDESLLDSAEAEQADQNYEQARVETNAQVYEAYEEWQSLLYEINNRTSAYGISDEEEQAVIRAKERYDELVRTQENILDDYDNDLSEKEKQQKANRSTYQEQADAYNAYLQDMERYDTYIPEYISFDSGQDYLSCKYLGENVYKLDFRSWYILLNIKTESVIFSSHNKRNEGHIERLITEFQDGFATVLYNDDVPQAVGPAISSVWTNGTRSLCSLGQDGTLTPIASNDWIQYQLQNDMEFSDGLTFVKDGSAGAFYDTMGEKIIDFPQYHDKNAYQCDPFYGGYAAMSIRGADGLNYITAINKNGDLMFEPKPGFDTVNTSKDGKYVTASKNGHITVFDIIGNPVISIDYVGIVQGQYVKNEYNVCDGVIKIKDFYVNVEDGTIIGLHGDGDAHFSVIVH